ncbi:MAG: leucine-rich repeat protein [Bacteroidales bacterium]|nr:leucine-rich repeat protein [Candidatus Sodaliphilus fimicaballi]
MIGSTINNSANRTTYRIVEIGDKAFAFNAAMTVCDMSNATNLRRIGQSAFLDSHLTTVKTKATVICAGAFAGCPLTSVELMEGVKTIEAMAFRQCTKLTTLNIPSTVTEIGPTFVNECSALTDISVASSNPVYMSMRHILYTKTGSLIRCPEGVKGAYSTFPTADNYDFPTNLTTVEIGAFENCTNVYRVYLPYGVKSIGAHAFRNSGVTVCVIPSTVTYMGAGLFKDATHLRSLFVNIKKPFIVTSEMFSGCEMENLYVPYGSVANYRTTNYWYAWKNIISGSLDLLMPGYIGYTVSSTKPETINGVAYDGRVKLTNAQIAAPTSGVVDIPDYVTTMDGKKYAVTSVDGESFYITSGDYKARLGANVDSICENAFYHQSHLTDIELGANLKYLGMNAFDGTSITQAILPLGFKELKASAFKDSKVQRLLVPSTCSSLSTEAFRDMTSAQEIILNVDWGYHANYTTGTTPQSCKIYVPTGVVKQYQSVFSKFGNNVQAGAFDFTYGTIDKMAGSNYHMTVTSTSPITVGGVRYDGKAKYVYYPTIANKTGFTPGNYETYAYYGGDKKYLITEIGDSCFFYAQNITKVDLERITYLERIGKAAFSFCGITTATVPRTVTEIGEYAFCYATSLTDLTLMEDYITPSFKVGHSIFGYNAPSMQCYVNIDRFLTLKDKFNEFSTGNGRGDDKICPWFRATNDTQVLGFPIAVDYEKAGIEAYSISKYDMATRKLTTSRLRKAAPNAGVLCVNLTKDNIYKIPRITGGSMEGYLRPTSAGRVNVYEKGGMYWNPSTKTFVKPIGSYYVEDCRAYLLLPSDATALAPWSVDILSKSGLKGDVNGDGVVDIADVNAVIDIILGMQSKKAAADLNGDGVVDVADMNAIIDIILGL